MAKFRRPADVKTFLVKHFRSLSKAAEIIQCKDGPSRATIYRLVNPPEEGSNEEGSIDAIFWSFERALAEGLREKIRKEYTDRPNRLELEEELERKPRRDLFRIRPVVTDDVTLFDCYVENTLLEYSGPKQKDVLPRLAPSRLWRHQTAAGDVFKGREQDLAKLDVAWNAVVNGTPGRAKIISLIAVGGAGKSTVVSRWKARLLSREEHGKVKQYFDWSFYTGGVTNTDSRGNVQTASDSTEFIREALIWFGDEATAKSTRDASKKGEALGKLASTAGTLLILDGLEPLQRPSDGSLEDEAIRGLFEALKLGNGLCIVTTRIPVLQLAESRATTTQNWVLKALDEEAGRKIFRQNDIIGSDEELEAASREVKGHALTISLMARYLHLAYSKSIGGAHISKRNCFNFRMADSIDKLDKNKNGDAFRVFAAYERWFAENDHFQELQILMLLGLFDRPVPPDCIEALRSSPIIVGLADQIAGVKATIATSRLESLQLVETKDFKPTQAQGYDEDVAKKVMEAVTHGGEQLLPTLTKFEVDEPKLPYSIDAHPLLREYFSEQLQARGLAEKAHGRVFDHLLGSVPYWPEGYESLQPLYQAISHGCKAGRFKSAYRVFRERICRGTQGNVAWYSTKKLGLFGQNLSALACFFVDSDAPWSTLTDELDPLERAWVASIASFNLRALNRLEEARAPARKAAEMFVELKDWREAARVYRDLSTLELALGNIEKSVADSTLALKFADTVEPENYFLRMTTAAACGHVMSEAGKLQESRAFFQKSEDAQTRRTGSHDRLFAVEGFQYCNHLLVEIERVAWGIWLGIGVTDPMPTDKCLEDLAKIAERAKGTLAWVEAENRNWKREVGLNFLTLSRTYLLRSILEPDSANLELAANYLKKAKDQAGQLLDGDAILSVLLSLSAAWLHANQGDFDMAREELDSSFELAACAGTAKSGWRGCLRLQIADTLLYRARIFGKRQRQQRDNRTAISSQHAYPWSDSTVKSDLDEVESLVKKCGYLRLDKEVSDAKGALREGKLV